MKQCSCLVTPLQNDQLIEEVTLEEVERAVFELDGQSVADSDGFAGCFYTHCWEIIAEDVF